MAASEPFKGVLELIRDTSAHQVMGPAAAFFTLETHPTLNPTRERLPKFSLLKPRNPF